MDLTPLVQGAEALAIAVAVPVAPMLARRCLQIAENRFHVTVSAQTEAKVIAAVDAGVGVLTAKLASAQMNLSDVHFGNVHVDDAVTRAMDIAGAAAADTGLTREVLASRIVGALGKALGEDPTVPTVPKAT